jgi:hypothetical protein
MAKNPKPWLEQAGKYPIAHIGGIPHINEGVLLDAPRTGVLHTTEGGWAGSLAIFKHHFAPHFMLGFDADVQKVRIAQLVQVGTIGAALRAHNNQAIVQVEMIGRSKEKPWLPDDETVEALASLMAACANEYAIPLEHPWPDGDFGKFGKIRIGRRVSTAQCPAGTVMGTVRAQISTGILAISNGASYSKWPRAWRSVSVRRRRFRRGLLRSCTN